MVETAVLPGSIPDVTPDVYVPAKLGDNIPARLSQFT